MSNVGLSGLATGVTSLNDPAIATQTEPRSSERFRTTSRSFSTRSQRLRGSRPTAHLPGS